MNISLALSEPRPMNPCCFQPVQISSPSPFKLTGESYPTMTISLFYWLIIRGADPALVRKILNSATQQEQNYTHLVTFYKDDILCLSSYEFLIFLTNSTASSIPDGREASHHVDDCKDLITT